MLLKEKLSEKNWMTRIGAGAALSIGALGLAGCSTAGPETGTDVEDVQESAEEVEEQVEENVETAAEPGFEGLYTDEFYEDAESLDGQTVVVSAKVNEVIDENSFTIAGTDETTVEELLIVHDGIFPDVEEGAVVQVTGVVHYLFAIEDVEGEFGITLDEDLFVDFEASPYIAATDIDAIVDDEVVDDELEE